MFRLMSFAGFVKFSTAIHALASARYFAQMKICLCGQSALEAWRHFDNRVLGKPVFGHTPEAGPTLPAAFPVNLLPAKSTIPEGPRDLTFIRAYDFAKLGVSPENVHILINRDNRTRKLANITTHTVQKKPGKHAFLRIDHDVYATRPELTILNVCSQQELIESILLMYEFCGCYSIQSGSCAHLRQRHPLTSVADLRKFANKHAKTPGLVTMRQALRYTIDGSGSPRETATTMLLCLPKRLGGFGLPFPELNVQLPLKSGNQILWGDKNAFDLVWKKAKLVLEYDGTEGHSADESRDRDSNRRDALIAEGYTVLTLTKGQLADARKTFGIAKLIAKKLGVRLRFENPGTFRSAHRELRRRVLSSHR